MSAKSASALLIFSAMGSVSDPCGQSPRRVSGGSFRRHILFRGDEGQFALQQFIGIDLGKL